MTAEPAAGAIAWCGPCARQRSTAGKASSPRPLPPGPRADILDLVSHACAAVRQAQRDLDGAVTRARLHGRPWAQIATRLGTTRQAAQQRFRKPR